MELMRQLIGLLKTIVMLENEKNRFNKKYN